MLTLVLMRHAKSDWSFSEPDHDRPLNKRGRRSASALGDWLRAQDLHPDTAYVSSALRTRETHALLNMPGHADHLRQLYEAMPDTYIELAEGADARQRNTKTLLMVGHNPGIGIAARWLCKAAPDHDRFDDYPTGATLVLDFPVSRWLDIDKGLGIVRAFVVPRDLIA